MALCSHGCAVCPGPYHVVSPHHPCLLLSGSLFDLPRHLFNCTDTFSPAPSMALDRKVLSCLELTASLPSLLTFIFSLLAFPPLLSLCYFVTGNFWWLHTPTETCTANMSFILSFLSKCLNNSEASILGCLHSSNSRVVSPLHLAQKTIEPCWELVWSITRVHHAKRILV